MISPKIKKLADILVNYSVEVKKGYIIKVNCGVEAHELGIEVCRLILKKDAFPRLNLIPQNFAYMYFRNATMQQLEEFPKISYYEAKNVDGSISIGAEYNTRELTNIEPKKIAIRQKVTKKISEVVLAKDNWVGCEFPTNAMAQDADMSLDEFREFAFNATNQDWSKMSKKQDKLKKILDKGKQVRIVGEDTDITFSIEGRQGIKCDGHRNMPDGEVFVGPVENTTEGHIRYSFPAIKGGREVDGIYLEFSKGKVVKAEATKNENFLKEMIKIDKGASYLGEFGIGLNFGINRFIKNILFDEKIGGTIHLALGMAYKEGGGRNESAIHWDMIKDLRKGGAVYIDGKCIQKNGKFTFKL